MSDTHHITQLQALEALQQLCDDPAERRAAAESALRAAIAAVSQHTAPELAEQLRRAVELAPAPWMPAALVALEALSALSSMGQTAAIAGAFTDAEDA